MGDVLSWLPAPPEVAGAWRWALDDAAVPHHTAVLLMLPMTSRDGHLACYLGKDRHVDIDIPDLLLADLNEIYGRHRVLLFPVVTRRPTLQACCLPPRVPQWAPAVLHWYCEEAGRERRRQRRR